MNWCVLAKQKLDNRKGRWSCEQLRLSAGEAYKSNWAYCHRKNMLFTKRYTTAWKKLKIFVFYRLKKTSLQKKKDTKSLKVFQKMTLEACDKTLSFAHLIEKNGLEISKDKCTRPLDSFWLTKFQREDHDQQFSKLSIFQRTIGRWLKFDFWLVDTLSDYWDSSPRIMINKFQILHSFSEKLVAGWDSTGELRPIFFR